MAETTYRVARSDDGHVVEEDAGDGYQAIATFLREKDAQEFLKLKRDEYTDVTYTWLESPAFYQRFKQFHGARRSQARAVAVKLHALG